MAIERDAITRALIFMGSIVVFLGLLVATLELKETWLVVAALTALVLPFFVAGFVGATKGPGERRFPVQRKVAAFVFLLPGVVAMIAGVYLLDENPFGLALVVLIGPLLILAWWAAHK